MEYERRITWNKSYCRTQAKLTLDAAYGICYITTTKSKQQKEINMKIATWDPNKGDCYQGDICLFRIPDSIKIDKSVEINKKDNRLILAEGEVTGHHHSIWLRYEPAMFRDDAIAREMMTMESNAVASLFSDPKAIANLVKAGELTSAELAIGILSVEGGTMLLTHNEHDAIRIPPGNYYVGNQREWDAAQARKVAD